ncbi:endonuclease [Portibacter lacus]|uniref:Endonuclease n=2 Tax=Portibacter lacus TaxID=1099794 RepID=A0AA37SJY4_9BACT|nr:endonuclease [Portibacter lacus]
MGGFAIFYIFRNVDEKDLGGYEIPTADHPENRFYLPTGSNGELIHHTYYSLAYNEKMEQADWVAYELTKAQLLKPNVKRERQFRPDYDVSTQSAFHRDYTRSGYTRGHLAPAGDMAFNVEAMKESFFMSNMSPQLESFNGGIWRELEENIRDWAFDNDRLYIVTGPVLKKGIIKKIGDNKVAVPKYFFKVVLDIVGNEKKGIGFIMENEMSEVPLQEYAITIDSVEQFTGFDFFSDLITEDVEEEIESKVNVKDWRFDKRKFEDRNTRYR